MFGAKKKPPRSPQPPKQARGANRNLAQFGLMDMDDGFDGGDGDLEDELNKLMFDGSKATRPKKQKAAVPDLESMVASCMKDIPSDDDVDDEDDPDLLGELAELDSEEEQHQEPKQSDECSGMGGSCAGQDMLSLIESRITMYTVAEQKSKSSGDAAKARRFSRGLATLTDLRRKVKTGKAVNPDDIPPAIATPSAPSSQVTSPMGNQPELVPVSVQPAPQPAPRAVPPPPVAPRAAPLPPVPARAPPPAPVEPPPEIMVEAPAVDPEVQRTIALLKQKREAYKEIALSANKEGDKMRALAGLQALKQCEQLLKAVNEGQTISINDLPHIPQAESQTQESVTQQSSNQPLNRTFSRDDPIQMPENPEGVPPPDPSVFGAPPPPATVAEALQQRLAKYRDDENKAKQEGNSSRARRIGRICQQYDEAIKLHRAGKSIPIADLPTPPGFGPIPEPGAVSSPKPPASMSAQNSGSSLAVGPTKPAHSPGSASPALSASSPASAEKAKPKSMSLQEKQLLILEKRQAKFKEAALEAKRTGQIEQAKEYLRQAKGFDKLIEATKCGLPVDFNTVPVPPQEVKSVNTGFVIVSKEDCNPDMSPMGTDRQEMYAKLEKDLLEQIKMCEENKTYFKSTGDVASSNKFQQMLEHTKKTLEALRFSFKRGDPVPKFHYEVRAFSRIVCNTDLADNDLEFTVMQGNNLAGPKEMQTFCKIEFPYPKETPFIDRSVVVKGTKNPEYNHKVIIPLNRKEKSCQRVFKRGVAKIEIWLKGGFLRSDTLLGSAQIKLLSLETVCELHDSFALMDGRKAIGGEVEVKVRIRNPIVSKQIEQKEESWLVISF